MNVHEEAIKVLTNSWLPEQKARHVSICLGECRKNWFVIRNRIYQGAICLGRQGHIQAASAPQAFLNTS